MTLHKDLVLRSEKWLRSQGCKVVIRDDFKAPFNTEHPDVIGWRDGISIVIEVKTSVADFRADRKKPFRLNGRGMGDWRFYLCPPDMINLLDLPPAWGLLWATEKTIQKKIGVPTNTGWCHQKPFTANRDAEANMLVSALRRFAVRGQLDTIYLPIDQISGECKCPKN